MNRRAAHCIAVIALLCPLVVPAQHRRGSTGASSAPQPLKGVTISFHGTIDNLAKKEILLASDDHQLVSFRRTSKTKFYSGDQAVKADEFGTDDVVTIEAVEDNDLKFLAVAVHLDPEQPARKDKSLITR